VSDNNIGSMWQAINYSCKKVCGRGLRGSTVKFDKIKFVDGALKVFC